jgi:hypothetical protein
MDFRKSTHSGGSGGSCVEVASNGTVHVRDTKNNGTGPTLRLPADAWEKFTTSLK